MPRSRLHWKTLVTAALAATALAMSTGAAAVSYSASPGPSLRLTADTPAPCNAPAPRGVARCLAVVYTPANHRITADVAGPPSGALGPAEIQAAYRLPAGGDGQTVALVDAYDDPSAEQDLATFRAHYGLAPCTTASGCFRKVNQAGHQGNYPAPNSGWGLEISLDLDTVSAACPNCNILLVEADNDDIANLARAADEAVQLGPKYVSNSYGASEFPGELSEDRYYDHPGVAVTASAGDSGYGTIWPSASQYVTAVGGTTLTKDASVPRGWQETVWGSASGGEGTGSGCSSQEPKPARQNGVTTDCGRRAVADISADANPASGLAVYDNFGYGGWLQVGGTSLSSPLIAAAYALAGPPVAGTYPADYPYHDPHQSADLFDITKGANGPCRTVLCQAGKGWDGPTGLGTPDGVKGLASGPQGQITGQVISQATGKPVPGAMIAAGPGDYVTQTGANGDFGLQVTAGSYRVTASDFEYASVTRSGVRVTGGQTTTADFALTELPNGSLAGTVTDGSGHGWPLHAQIAVSGDPGAPVWTSPYTGRYSVRLPQGSYQVTVSAAYPGYQPAHLEVTVGADTNRDIALSVNKSACTAPGYGPDGLTQDFAGWAGGTPRDGWRISDQGRAQAGWRFDNPGNRPPPPRASVIPHPGWPPVFTQFDSDEFAVADAGFYAPRPLDTELASPPVNLAGQIAPEVTFDSAYYPAGGRLRAGVQLSTDGGKAWSTVWQRASGDALGPVIVAIPQAAGHSKVEVRFGLTGGGDGYWAVGDVLIGTGTCVPVPGSLLVGGVSSRAGQPIDGAQIASSANPGPQPWPAGISLATGDPALPSGYYWLFTPRGRQHVTATAAGYRTGSATVTVSANKVVRRDWTLAPARR
jgi:Carboxypeptidase regulatory-like domain